MVNIYKFNLHRYVTDEVVDKNMQSKICMFCRHFVIDLHNWKVSVERYNTSTMLGTFV